LRDGLYPIDQFPHEEWRTDKTRWRQRCLRGEVECERFGARLLHLPRRQRRREVHQWRTQRRHRRGRRRQRLCHGLYRLDELPDAPGTHRRTINASGNDEAFMTELDLDGSGLVYSTYLGGSGRDRGRSIAVDGAGNAYIAGMTAQYGPSDDFPVRNAFQ